MFFLVDTNKKIIFGWSAKCGCSHIKNIFWFLKTNKLKNQIHTMKEMKFKLPDDIENYITIIIIRNPYERILSGFLDKYKKNGAFRHSWKDSVLSFSKFVDKLINDQWKTINRHHFTPQTTEKFDKKILLSKIIKFYDIGKINYEYIEQLYNKKIPECVINKKLGHERLLNVNVNSYYDNYVYNLHIDHYINYNINIKYFYNEEIKDKVYNFFINDFILFKENGFDYKKSTF
tara:strand:- start:523 stop:1218 length:696 start_codon:yes stop_codon:yes gene_type:complete